MRCNLILHLLQEKPNSFHHGRYNTHQQRGRRSQKPLFEHWELPATSQVMATNDQGRSGLWLHVLGSKSQQGFTVALQHLCLEEHPASFSVTSCQFQSTRRNKSSQTAVLLAEALSAIVLCFYNNQKTHSKPWKFSKGGKKKHNIFGPQQRVSNQPSSETEKFRSGNTDQIFGKINTESCWKETVRLYFEFTF